MGAWERVTLVAVVVVGLAVAVLTAVNKAWLGSAIGILVPVGVVIAATLRYLDATASNRLEIEQLEARLRELKDARETQLAARTDAQAKVEKFRARPLLRDFAADQAQRWLERERPGKITEIRLRFDQLSTLITENLAAREHGNATAGDVPPIERVIVYIDDLDRCEWRVVVKVLEAIKLLLAVPHFVVIVGVDSRWLCRSLVQRFAQMRDDDGAGSAIDSTRSTPQNYLEKIFQYSLVLPPMSDKGFGQLVKRLLSPAETKPTGDGRGAPVTANPSDAPQRSDAEEAATPTSAAPSGDVMPTPPRAAVDATPATASSEHAAPAPTTLDLTPTDLNISPDEVAAMTALAPLFDTPRAAKRLTNLYRLIRVAVGADLLLDDVAYQPLMVLLASSLTHPDEAIKLFAAVQAHPDGEWGQLVHEEPGPIVAMSSELVDVTRRLSKGPRPLDRRELRDFSRWIPDVTEFSFHPWRGIAPASAAPPDAAPRGVSPDVSAP